MTDQSLLNEAFGFIMKQMIACGQAPHYVELAAEFDMSPEDGRKLQQDLFSAGIAGWLHPGTDLIASFAPFNNLPTMYRITIDDQQRWFGQ